MSIRAKERDIFYLSCVLCDSLNELENILGEAVESRNKILYHPHTQYLFKVRDRLINVLLQTDNNMPAS